jgi:tetratricopeptide (TPR) repeat protein
MLPKCANSRSMFCCALLCCALGGCQTFSRRGPVPKDVQNCRELSAEGMAAMDLGDWQRAEKLLDDAVRSCPVDAESRRRYAEALWHRGEANAAMDQLEEAARLAPDKPEVAIRMGEIYLSLDRWENARRAADQALAINRANPSAWSLRARANEANGDLRQAMADFQRALAYQPGDRATLEQLAELYRHMGQPERALTALQMLIDTYPPGDEQPRALHLQGLALAALHRHEAAVDSYDLAIRRGGPSPDLYCHLAESELAAGHSEQAQRAVEKALSMAPEHVAGRNLAERIQTARANQPGASMLR